MRFAPRDKVKALLAKNAMLVDMRSPVHFRDDPVEGAVNLPLKNLVNSLMLLKDKKKPVILFSATSSDSDLKMGVTYAENMSFDVYITDLNQLRDEPVKKTK